ncbi:LysR family transcriptional regulator [Colwellia sp. RE-S-Sl-9]
MIQFDPNGIPDISLRQLRALVYVAEYQNVTKASKELNRSQTAITKAISDLELTVGKKLFDRTSTGMILTPHGKSLTVRSKRAMDEFKKVGDKLLEYSDINRPVENIPIFSMDISYKRLSAFIALYHLNNYQRAAEQLNITKAAIYSSVRQMEEWLEMPLFNSAPSGVSPVPFCHVLAQHIKLAFAEIRHGIEDMANIDGITCGNVKIGTLPYTRTYLTPNAINKLLKEYPGLGVTTYEGTYELMESSLRSGDIDLIIGAVRTMDKSNDIKTEILLEDKLSIVARKHHPLMNKSKVTLNDLNEYGWILPEFHTPAGKLFIETMNSHGCSLPDQAIHTSSLSMIRGLLISSDRVALLSKHQIFYDEHSDLLDVLPVKMDDTYRSIGITMRKHTEPSPAAQLFLNKLRQVADEIVVA